MWHVTFTERQEILTQGRTRTGAWLLAQTLLPLRMCVRRTVFPNFCDNQHHSPSALQPSLKVTLSGRDTAWSKVALSLQKIASGNSFTCALSSLEILSLRIASSTASPPSSQLSGTHRTPFRRPLDHSSNQTYTYLIRTAAIHTGEILTLHF
ncbi:hypothetical protein N658DRAFT_129176 [Parathielavia hyrcaniae]|uniref:Uncharacterized protein n=1 Tax=Parathielavia hyrcaniae TaxID=113614 RepID=A0AAN6T5A2_9PEZI|nr:hypothetical protein N658DRAFT_129176 [Parathielavia hyrcaniae]